MSSTGLTAATCPAAAYIRDLSPTIFYCTLPPDHDGDHENHPDPETTVTWSPTIYWTITPKPLARPMEEPFDRSREQWFSGFCANPSCYGQILGRSLDGAPAYWWHDLSVLDNDHDADPGDRKEPS